jgi:SAM-dependent methyltransferase
MIEQRQRHRGQTGRHYLGTPIHAGPGVHERALDIAKAVFPEGARLADLGAGSGALSLRLKHAGFQVIALDRDVSEISSGIEVIEADLSEGLPPSLRESELDGGVAIEVVEHLTNPVGFLMEVHRILKPGSGLLLSTPNVLHPYSRLKFFLKGSYWLFDEHAYWSTGHMTPLPLWLLKEHMARAGFDSLQHGYGGSFEMKGLRRLVVSTANLMARPRGCPLGVRSECTTLFLFGRKSSG